MQGQNKKGVPRTGAAKRNLQSWYYDRDRKVIAPATALGRPHCRPYRYLFLGYFYRTKTIAKLSEILLKEYGIKYVPPRNTGDWKPVQTSQAF